MYLSLAVVNVEISSDIDDQPMLEPNTYINVRGNEKVNKSNS